MENYKLYNGFNSEFLSDEIIKFNVELPTLNKSQLNDLAKTDEGTSVIKYINYSLELSALHKFPYYTASNIDGILFKKAPRKDNWRKDSRIEKFQWGKELYGAKKSDFDRGHMTKREDVQWGDTVAIAMNAADSTFYYSNAVPQHKDLNQDIWRSLEDYILNTETTKNQLKVCVFTGPVLRDDNPYFVTPIEGKLIQIPFLFWKVVIFRKADNKLYRVGFLMSQNKLLKKYELIEGVEAGSSDEELFMQFEEADTYQVNIKLIEELSGLAMPKAIDSYTDERSLKLVLNEVDIDPELESDSVEQNLGFTIENIVL